MQVVGVNASSARSETARRRSLAIDPRIEREQIERVCAPARAARDAGARRARRASAAPRRRGDGAT